MEFGHSMCPMSIFVKGKRHTEHNINFASTDIKTHLARGWSSTNLKGVEISSGAFQPI